MDMTDRQRALLAFVAANSRPEDPIRIMKGLFLFSREANVPDSMVYEFVPYSYGPCSFAIYDDLDEFAKVGYVERVQGASRWSRYVVTESGRSANLQFTLEHSDYAAKLGDIRRWVDERSFSGLLHDVYERFPDFATKSIFRG